MSEPPAGKLRCVVVTPEGQLVDQAGEFVVLTAHDGQFGILPGRSPLLCKLAAGMLRIDQGDTNSLFFVVGGFAEVMDDTVTVITTKAVSAKKDELAGLKRELQPA